MAFDISNSYMEEFDFMFHEMLKQRGTQLLPFVRQMPVQGDTKHLRQFNVGGAYFVDDTGGSTQYTQIYGDERTLRPRAFECPIELNKFDLVRQGTLNVQQIAQEAADACGVLIDDIILSGIYGPAKTKSSGSVSLPDSQIIGFAANDFSIAADVPDKVKNGLNVSKVADSVQRLRTKFNRGSLICVASNYALTTLRADPKAANSLWNASGPSLSLGQNAPYGGVDAFVPSERVEKNVTFSSGNTGEYAYVYARDQIFYGESMPLTMDEGKNAERGLNPVLIYSGMADCVRMQEEAVIKIQVKTN
ncbi:MAG: hypothetical protein LBQ08_05105 [Holosporaceae bacterium]|jgi:hypothetical protein|nr:hypothetical protein [Holosporaceae bacterium]